MFPEHTSRFFLFFNLGPRPSVVTPKLSQEIRSTSVSAFYDTGG